MTAIPQTHELLTYKRSNCGWIVQPAFGGRQLSVLRWQCLEKGMDCVGISMRQGEIGIVRVELQRMTDLAVGSEANPSRIASFFIKDMA